MRKQSQSAQHPQQVLSKCNFFFSLCMAARSNFFPLSIYIDPSFPSVRKTQGFFLRLVPINCVMFSFCRGVKAPAVKSRVRFFFLGWKPRKCQTNQGEDFSCLILAWMHVCVYGCECVCIQVLGPCWQAEVWTNREELVQSVRWQNGWTHPIGTNV